jgi:hypothetical protein
VELEPDGDGTLVRLTNRGLPARRVHRSPPTGAGWEHCLDRLATCAAGGDPGPDPLRVG